jgi:ribosomal protein L10
MPSQQVLEAKSTEVESIKDILKEYKSIGIASLKKVRASQLQEIKKTMAGKVYLRVLKNTLIKIALELLGWIKRLLIHRPQPLQIGFAARTRQS